MGTDFVGYWINNEHRSALSRWPGERDGVLYNYCFGSSGVSIHAHRPGLEVCFPLAECDIRGLTPVESLIELGYERVPAHYLQTILARSLDACIDEGKNTEALFHLIWLEEENRWRLDKPEQEATAVSVRPTDDGEGSSYQLALIEVHSHHNMDPDFSSIDDADEQGFRIYGVIGNIFTEPKLRVRIGCFGYFYEVPADTIFEMPEGIGDAREGGMRSAVRRERETTNLRDGGIDAGLLMLVALTKPDRKWTHREIGVCLRLPQ